MKWEISDKTIDSEFVAEVERLSIQNLSDCYQCGKCSAGCPICPDMDYSPNQVIRLVQLGLREQVLSSSAIWLCASCQTCTVRCPKEIDIAKIMDTLRIISHIEDKNRDFKLGQFLKKTAQRTYQGILDTFEMNITSNLKTFSKVFLQSIRQYGRLSETGLFMNYNINSGFLMTNALKAPVLFMKGKVKVAPPNLKSLDRVRRIFDRIEELQKIEEH